MEYYRQMSNIQQYMNLFNWLIIGSQRAQIYLIKKGKSIIMQQYIFNSSQWAHNGLKFIL